MDYNKLNHLIKKLKNGERRYFDKFYELTKTGVYCVIKKIVSSNSNIDDIMQETYISFVNNLHKIDDNYNPYSYLLRIAHNKAIDIIRTQNNNEQAYLEETEGFNENYTTDWPLLDYCKNNLDNEEYQILELTVVMGYRRVEVAQMIKQPISTVNWKYNKILKKVKKFYKEVYNEI